MLSSLPKLVDKQFVIGFIVPVLVGVLAIVALLRDIGPFSSVYTSMIAADSFTKLTVFVLSLWTIAVLLMLFNYRLYKFLEGYSGFFNRKSWQDKMRVKYERETRALAEKYHRNSATRSADAEDEYLQAYQDFEGRWPSELERVLPTRFGNVIRAFETYALKVYGVDSIAAWPRMEALIPKDFRTAIDDARAQVDFYVNLWLLAILFAVIAIVRSFVALYLNWHLPTDLSNAFSQFSPAWEFAAAAIGAIAIALAAYEGAVDQASGWGELVKSAFDLYLPALAKQLGYELPPTEVERRRFWNAINNMFLYREPLPPERWLKPKLPDKPTDNKENVRALEASTARR